MLATLGRGRRAGGRTGTLRPRAAALQTGQHRRSVVPIAAQCPYRRRPCARDLDLAEFKNPHNLRHFPKFQPIPMENLYWEDAELKTMDMLDLHAYPRLNL